MRTSRIECGSDDTSKKPFGVKGTPGMSIVSNQPLGPGFEGEHRGFRQRLLRVLAVSPEGGLQGGYLLFSSLL